MESKRPTEESTDRGVSPVIGVILMVAITVILAAVIAAFVLDIGPDGDSQAPNAQLDFEENNSDIEISHNGGESLDLGSVDLRGDNDEASFASDDEEKVMQTGDTATIENADGGDEILLVWDRGDSGDIIDSYTPSDDL